MPEQRMLETATVELTGKHDWDSGITAHHQKLTGTISYNVNLGPAIDAARGRFSSSEGRWSSTGSAYFESWSTVEWTITDRHGGVDGKDGGRLVEVSANAQFVSHRGQLKVDFKFIPVESMGNYEQKARAAYEKSNYTYNDAKIVAAQWKKPNPSDGKIIIGDKILMDRENLLPPVIKGGSGISENQARAAFEESNYTYGDAKVVAAQWKKPNSSDGKIIIGDKILMSRENLLPPKIRGGSGKEG